MFRGRLNVKLQTEKNLFQSTFIFYAVGFQYCLIIYVTHTHVIFNIILIYYNNNHRQR